jgi:hypothetical protein
VRSLRDVAGGGNFDEAFSVQDGDETADTASDSSYSGTMSRPITAWKVVIVVTVWVVLAFIAQQLLVSG